VFSVVVAADDDDTKMNFSKCLFPVLENWWFAWNSRL